MCVCLREREQHTQKPGDGKDVEEMKGQGGQPVVSEGSEQTMAGEFVCFVA